AAVSGRRQRERPGKRRRSRDPLRRLGLPVAFGCLVVFQDSRLHIRTIPGGGLRINHAKRLSQVAEPHESPETSQAATPALLSSAGARSALDMATTPILLLSLPRSGSTLVQRVLAAHPGVATASEPWLLLPLLLPLRDDVPAPGGWQPRVHSALEDFARMLPA